MNEDLISREVAIQELRNFADKCGNSELKVGIEYCIVVLSKKSNIPTVFNKERVIAQIMEERNEAKEDNQESAMIAHEIDIEIVKKGGI